jgi:para-nitrobenzyl esterase
MNTSDPELTPSDLKISEAMGAYWTNFTKTLNPNGPGVPTWPAFRENDQKVMYFNQTPYVGTVPGLSSMMVLDSYFEWRRTEEGQKWGNEN